MEGSPQEQGSEARGRSEDAVMEFRNHIGAPEHVEEGNDALSGSGAATTSAPGKFGGAKYKLRSPCELPISRSPCTLIDPPSLSPISFMESPVFLANIKAEPSPTTGTFFLSKHLQGASEAAAVSLARNCSTVAALDQTKCNSFEFQFNNGNGATAGPNESLHDEPLEILNEKLSPMAKEISAPAVLAASSSETAAVDSDLLNRRGPQNCGIQMPCSDNKDTMSWVPNERSADDAYNWRKYGQKLVKGCEFPRSYYKCTYPNCEVKKIFERSPDGQIKEIVYKGSHDHPKPQPNRRLAAGGLISNQEERFVKDASLSVLEGNTNIKGQINNIELSSTPMLSLQENEDGPDATLQLQRVSEEIDDDDPFSKKRKLEGGVDETSVKPIREPRVVVQTESEVDILDDGYRWRKYGQKVVRGNPNPRSYYKCTNTGCSVRKHVERASHDPKAVINTYEGKHNHDVPTARTSSNESGIPRFRSDENDSSRVGINYVQSIRPMDSSSWNLNMFRPTFQSIFQ